MDAEIFSILFPILTLIFYLNIKILVDNKNNRSTWLEEVYSFPIDINFLGIGYIGGMMVLGETFSLLGVVILLLFTSFTSITKVLANKALNLYYSNKKSCWIICLLNYVISIYIIYKIISNNLF